MPYKKLFIPGPTHVRDEILQAQTAPMIGHRMKEYTDLQGAITPKLQQLLYTKQPVLIFASSSTGVMEGAVRNCVGTKCLNTVCGEFSRRWAQITEANGKDTGQLTVDAGQAITPEMIDEKLSSGEFDSITVVHNETSTGVMNPIVEIGAMIRDKYPDVIYMVDAVSSMAGAKIEFDTSGIDVLLAGVQKCFALPAGLAVCALSDRAIERTKTVPNRGLYFDFIDMLAFAEKNQTPATPAVSLMQALNKQLDDMLAEGLENRWSRHIAMATHVQSWACEKFALFSDPRYLSLTVTNIVNTRGFDFKALNTELGNRGATISDGYGPLKGKAFRIAHMGDLTLNDVRWVTAQVDDILGI